MFKRLYTFLIPLALLAGVALAGATNSPTVSATPSNQWTTVLSDSFTSAGIPDHWKLYDGHYGSGPSNNCATPSQDSAPGDGYLHLIMSYKSSGTCGAGWYEGGMQIAKSFDFPQQAVTVRWRILPSANPTAVHAHHIVPMLWPDDSAYKWYQGEDDFCESSSLTSCTTYLHDGTSSNTNRQVTHSYTVDLTKFHTWRFEQRNGTLLVYIDNLTTPVWSYSSTTALPNAMRRAVLQQECPGGGCPSASYAGMKEDMEIDWITIQVPATSAPAPTNTPAPVTPTNTPAPTPTKGICG